MTVELLGIREVAALTGLQEQSVRAYLYRHTMPQPDVRLGGHPGWYRETVDRWLTTRDVRP